MVHRHRISYVYILRFGPEMESWKGGKMPVGVLTAYLPLVLGASSVPLGPFWHKVVFGVFGLEWAMGIGMDGRLGWRG